MTCQIRATRPCRLVSQRYEGKKWIIREPLTSNQNDGKVLLMHVFYIVFDLTKKFVAYMHQQHLTIVFVKKRCAHVFLHFF